MSAVSVSVIDESQIGGLAEAAGVEGVRMILEAFWTSTEELYAELSVAIDADDRPGMARIGHTLKGSSANIGAAQMADRAKQIETAAKDGEIELVRERLKVFMEDITATRAAIDDILRRYA